jgi:hypothetical protein
VEFTVERNVEERADNIFKRRLPATYSNYRTIAPD